MIIQSADDAWLETVLKVTNEGQLIAPQKSMGAGGKVSSEILQHTLSFDMQYPIVTIKPNTSWLYMAAEVMWIIDGSNRLNYAPEIWHIQEKYSDNGISLAGAYGPMFVKQKAYVLEKLNSDQNTRQAVMNIWRSNPKPSKDLPCTTSLQFMLRDGRIHTMVTMRSSDVGKGLPYDMFSFACMTAEIASLLDDPVELGTCYITAGSRHIYEDQLTQLGALAAEFGGFYVSSTKHNAWQTWKWHSIKETLRVINAMPYENRFTAQVQAKSMILKASGG
jgi:thymidylate synthase